MSGLRDQTAAAAEAHRPYGLDCKCGLPINSDAGWARHFADVLSLALGLTEERRPFNLRTKAKPCENCGHLKGVHAEPCRIANWRNQGSDCGCPEHVYTAPITGWESRLVSGWSVVGETKP